MNFSYEANGNLASDGPASYVWDARDHLRIRYQSCRDPLTTLRQRMRELAQTRVRFGYHAMLVDECPPTYSSRASTSPAVQTSL